MEIIESGVVMTRREARDAAFTLVFSKEINNSDVNDILEITDECGEIKINDYVKNTFTGVFEHIEEIDGIISKFSVSWDIKRISKVALAVLRLAIYEIEYDDSIPVSVSINEAVEITKKYSTKDDASFVNGVLSSVAKEKNERA